MKIENPEISIIMPCRNEEAALDFCITQAKKAIAENNLDAEIIISDSSTDSSPDIARKHKAVLVKHDKEGYGNAYLEGFRHARGKYIFMADADGTYDFSEIPVFVSHLENGYDFVIGDRFKRKMEKNSMPFLHKHLGNPFLSFTLRLFFKTKVNDAHCGMRAIKKDSLEKLDLQTRGMEFASEMIVNALKNGLKIKEVPINYYRRKGKSKIKPFRDAWRHMRFMLLYSPMFLFFIPGLFLLLLGLGTMLWFYFGNPVIFEMQFYFYPMFISSLFVLIGYQLVIFSAFARSYGVIHLGEKSWLMEKIYRYVTIEKAIVVGGAALLAGLGIFVYMLVRWINSDFNSLNELKNALVALTLIVLGIQTIFSSFMLSIIGININNKSKLMQR